MPQFAAEDVMMKDSLQKAQLTPKSHGAPINNLQNEILMEIFHYATMSNPHPRRYQPDTASDIQPDTRQWKMAMAKSQATAHALSLVSHRFNDFVKPFFFREILLVQNRLDIREWNWRDEPNRALRSSWQVREVQRLGTHMKRLVDVLRQNPAYGRYCRSLCLACSEVWVPPANENGNVEGDELGEIESDDYEASTEIFGNRCPYSSHYPRTMVFDEIYALLDNVTDFQIHCDSRGSTPNFRPAILRLPTITVIRITGEVYYPSVLTQLVRCIPQDSALQTLDLSETTCRAFGIQGWRTASAHLRKVQEAAGTARFTRLLTDPEMGTRFLEILLGWPRRLERLVLQTNTQQMSQDVHGGNIQTPLDIVKDSLIQLRIEGDYEVGLGGFDLRAFTCLEHLALCTATISNYNQNPRDGTTLPELDLHIFAPRLRSLLWVLPWWEQRQPKVKDFFGRKHEDRLRGLLQKAVEVKKAREVEGKEWCFERVWLETIRVPLESLEEKARWNFEKDLKRIQDLDDEFKGEGIRVRHLPFPRASVNAERRFPRLEEIWDWDEEALRRCEV